MLGLRGQVTGDTYPRASDRDSLACLVNKVAPPLSVVELLLPCVLLNPRVKILPDLPPKSLHSPPSSPGTRYYFKLSHSFLQLESPLLGQLLMSFKDTVVFEDQRKGMWVPGRELWPHIWTSRPFTTFNLPFRYPAWRCNICCKDSNSHITDSLPRVLVHSLHRTLTFHNYHGKVKNLLFTKKNLMFCNLRPRAKK